MGGLGPIPLTEVAAYVQLFQLDDDLDEVDRFVTMIRTVDSEYLAMTAARRATEQQATNAGVAGSKVPARRGRMRS